jgi:hypothetical protein
MSGEYSWYVSLPAALNTCHICMYVRRDRKGAYVRSMLEGLGGKAKPSEYIYTHMCKPSEYIYTHMYMYMYLYMHTYSYVYMYMHMYMYMYMYVYAYVCIYMHMYVHMHIDTAHTHTHRHTHTRSAFPAVRRAVRSWGGGDQGLCSAVESVGKLADRHKLVGIQRRVAQLLQVEPALRVPHGGRESPQSVIQLLAHARACTPSTRAMTPAHECAGSRAGAPPTARTCRPPKRSAPPLAPAAAADCTLITASDNPAARADRGECERVRGRAACDARAQEHAPAAASCGTESSRWAPERTGGVCSVDAVVHAQKDALHQLRRRQEQTCERARPAM